LLALKKKQQSKKSLN